MEFIIEVVLSGIWNLIYNGGFFAVKSDLTPYWLKIFALVLSTAIYGVLMVLFLVLCAVLDIGNYRFIFAGLAIGSLILAIRLWYRSIKYFARRRL